MGYTTTEMLFCVYSRYASNRTRRDGSAFDNLNVSNLHPAMEAREHQYLKHPASAISHYLGNTRGTELICILGSGFEKDNRQALDTWVAYHHNEVFEKRLEGRSPLDFLIESLKACSTTEAMTGPKGPFILSDVMKMGLYFRRRIFQVHVISLIYKII